MNRTANRRALRERLFQQAQEERAIGKTGQAVVVRQKMIAVTLLFAQGGVMQGGNEVRDVSRGVAQRGNGRVHRVQRAVLSALHHLASPHASGENGLPELPVKLRILSSG